MNRNPYAPPNSEVDQSAAESAAWARASSFFRIRYRLTLLDLALFSLYHNLRQPLLWLILAGLVFFTVMGQIESLLARQGPVLTVLTVIVFAIALCALYMFVTTVLGAISMITRHAGNTLTDHTLELTEASVIEETAHTRTEIRWPGIHKVGVTRRYLLLYFGPHIAHVIPRRALADAASWDAWIQECQRRFRASRPAQTAR